MTLRQKSQLILGAVFILGGVLAGAVAPVQAAPPAPVIPDATAPDAIAPDSHEAVRQADNLSDLPLNRLLSITLDQLGTLAIDLAPKAEGISGSINFSGQSPSAKRCQVEFNGTRRSNGADLRLSPGTGRSDCGFNSEAAVKLDQSQSQEGNSVKGIFTLGNQQRGSFNFTLPR